MIYNMDWYWVLLIGLGFGVFECVWRRWFGGGFVYDWLKPINHRFIKHIVNIAAIFCVLFFLKGMVWYWSLYAAIAIQVLFWTLAFAVYFDIGHKGKPISEEKIKEYNKPWFAPILNWCFSEEYRYTAFYDYLGMFCRYTWPLLFVFWLPSFNSGLLVLGTLVAMVYGIGWVGYDKALIKKIGPTEFGEFVSGFCTGMFIVLNESNIFQF
jgi:hypothetical protein